MPVTYELRDRVACIVMDDGKANALDLRTVEDLHNALDRAADDERVGAVLIAGRPGRFSAGFDLATMTSGRGPMQELVTAGGRLTARLLLEPTPVVAACTGHALAAGGLLLLAADRRIGAAGDFKIGLNEVSIGMTLPKWAVELARYRLPPSEFDWRVVLGRTASPEEAVRAGFLDRVVPADSVFEEAVAVAMELSTLSTPAVEGTKHRARGPVAARMLEGMDT
ncbi:MAG TPA: crotonase/enoyl-CoA hydratase family protein, partial [Acidimicrobiales bacterium]|nr:crotonase/enoyl-CoA hydratase family protein [Acidimicrobiales bacterium]